MNKILTMLGSILIFTGLKAQDSSKVRKETMPAKQVKENTIPAAKGEVIPKLEHKDYKAEGKIDKAYKIEGKMDSKIGTQYKEGSLGDAKSQGKVISKVEAKDYKVQGNDYKVDAKDSKVEGKLIPKGEVIPKVEYKKTGNN